MIILGQLWNSRPLLSHSSQALCPVQNSSSSTNRRHHSAQQHHQLSHKSLVTPCSSRQLQHCCRAHDETIAASCVATADTQHSSTADGKNAEEHAAQQQQQQQQHGSQVSDVATNGSGLQQQSHPDRPAAIQQQQLEEDKLQLQLHDTSHQQQLQSALLLEQQQEQHQQARQQQQQHDAQPSAHTGQLHIDANPHLQQQQQQLKRKRRRFTEKQKMRKQVIKQQRQREQRRQHRQDIAGSLADFQQQLEQVTHWRHLLPLSADIQYESELLLLLEAALQLQPTTAAAAAADRAVGGLSASRQLFEQQQYVRYMQYLVTTATRLLLLPVKSPKAAAAAAGDPTAMTANLAAAAVKSHQAAAAAAVAAASAAKRQVLLKLLQLLIDMGPSLQQQLHQQLQRLPVAAVIQQHLQHMQPKQCAQVAVQLALLKPHMQLLPLQLQQQLFAAALAPTYRKHGARYEQQQQFPSVGRASQVLWAAASLGWQPKQQHLQKAVRAVLMQLPWCNGQHLAMALWGAARLGVTAAQLQQWWVELGRATQQQQQWQQQQQGQEQLPSSSQQQVAQLARPTPSKQQQQQEHLQQVSKVLSAALTRHSSQFSGSDFVAVTWAAAELQLLHDSGLMRVLLQGFVQPNVLMQLTDVDISSVLRSLALLRLKRGAATQGGSSKQPQQQQQQQHADASVERQQQYAGGLQQLQKVTVSGELLLWSSAEGAADDQLQQQWHKELQQHWCGTTGTSSQQQQQQQQGQHQQLEGQANSSKGQLEEEQQQQVQQHQAQELQLQQQRQQRRQQASTHAQQLAQPDLIPSPLVQPLLQAYYTTLPTCSSRCIAETLWSVSVLRVQPPREWMVGVLLQLQAQFAGGLGSGGVLDGKSCMLVAFALSRLRYLPDSRWLDGFWRTCLPLIPQQQQQQQQQRQQVGHSSTDLTSSSGGSSGARMPFTQAELTVLAVSAYELSLLSRPHHRGPWRGQKPPRVWLDAMAAGSLEYLNSQLDLRTLLLWGEVMMRFSSTAGEPWAGPGAAWWQGFEAATEPYLQAAEPRELLRLGKMLSTQRQHRPVGQGWVEAFLGATKASCLGAGALGVRMGQADAGAGSSHPGTGSGKPNSANAAAAAAAAGANGAGAKGSAAGSVSCSKPLSARNLANLGKAVAALGVCRDSEWLDKWELALELTGAGMTTEVGHSLQQTRAAFARLADGKQ